VKNIKKDKDAAMNADKAKQLDFPLLLEKMGYHPVQGGIKKGGNEIWYHSPLNANDKSPSFHISRGSHVAWMFKCFSTGEQGTIIDFVNAHEGFSPHNIKPALAYLRSKFPGTLFDYQKKKPKNGQSFNSKQQLPKNKKALAADRDLEFIEDLPLKSGKLLSYLEEERKIPRSLAQQYLCLVRYRNLKNGKSYYGIGMKNRAGGFEVRAGSDTYSFKSALIARDITIIEGSNHDNQILIFEGMTDFLSFLVIEGTDKPVHDVVVLHSVNSYARCKAFILENQYQVIHTFLDNDGTGEKFTKRFQEDFGSLVTTYSYKFQPFKDLNEALKEGATLDFFGRNYPLRNSFDLA